RNAKAILVTFHGVQSVNAGVVMQRVTDLAVLSRRMDEPALREDPTKFRIGVPLKPVHHWSCLWGQREDAMLLVGIYRHGFGNWDKIQTDVDLGLQKKLFLTPADEKAASVQAIGGGTVGTGTGSAAGGGAGGAGGSGGKRIVAPKATHLVRRGEYLLKVLRDGEESKNRPVSTTLTPSGTPLRSAGSRKRRVRSGEESDTNSASLGYDNERGFGAAGRVPGDVEDGELSEPESMDERTCKDMMRPVKRYLQRLRDEAEHTKSANSKVKLISECLLPIGRHIRSVIERKRPRGPGSSDGSEDTDKLYRHLWVFVTYFWRSPVEYTKLVRLFERLEENNHSSPQVTNAPASAGPVGSSPRMHFDSAPPGGSPVARHHSRGRSHSAERSASRSRSRSRSRDGDRHRQRLSSKVEAPDGLPAATSALTVSSAIGNGGAMYQDASSGSNRHRSNGSTATGDHHHHHHHSSGSAHRAQKSSSGTSNGNTIGTNNGRSQSKSNSGGVRPSRRESRRQ
ncbi:ATP-dependent DNA helicase Hrp3, partial [Kickxella alabastrina]